MNKYFKIIIPLILVIAVVSYLLWHNKNKANIQPINQLKVNNSNIQAKMANKPADTTNTTLVSEPISNALARVTKKPFGIKISPTNSPVMPERFSGYHTGVDFETTLSEQKTEVSIMAICDGKLVYKNWVNGYGGVVIASCSINKQPVTIIYGHLKLTSISQKVGDKLIAGNKLAVLGQAYSTETNGERKHLHLGIHQGSKIVFLGYVTKASALVDWSDVTKYLLK